METHPPLAQKKRDITAFCRAQSELEELKAQAQRGELTLAFVDEAGFTQTQPNRNAWTPAGECHATTAVLGKRLNIIGAMLSTGGLFSAKLWHNTTAELFAGFLGLLLEHVGKPLTVVLDNASLHTAKAVKPMMDLLKEQGLTLYFLPPYSPELNRIESLWRRVKHEWMAFKTRDAKTLEADLWDGKIDFSNSKKISQFGSQPPSDDALVTAAHLPLVEIRETLDEDEFVLAHKQESVGKSGEVYRAIADNLRKFEPQASKSLAEYLRKPVEQLTYTDYARSLAAFIRSEFRIKETKLEKLTTKSEPLSAEDLRGGLIFYGRGRCVVCHSGPHFSDFKFHAVPFPQLGFGKNGFGIDLGRFNVTFGPKDLYRFRTPPLYNVVKTAPYGHSGSVATVEEAIVAHFDPLRLLNPSSMEPLARHELYKRMTLGSETATTVGFLTTDDVDDLKKFLNALSF